jgi:hypothetical protein
VGLSNFTSLAGVCASGFRSGVVDDEPLPACSSYCSLYSYILRADLPDLLRRFQWMIEMMSD